MKILMLGNSLTTVNDMPQRLAELLSAKVVVHARGGARLAEQMNPDTRMGARTGQVLQEKKFDYVVLQEMSHGPATAPERYLESVRRLTRIIREADAEPVLYATWEFRPGCDQLGKIGMDASSMHEKMQETFRQAAKENDAIIANVGNAFRDWGFTQELYAPDGVHPGEAGSNLAAGVIADAILEYEEPGYASFDGKTVRITDIDGNTFTGECSWFSSGFGEAELGQAEEGLQIRRRVFFASTISKVEEI